MTHPTGWHYLPDQIAETCERMHSHGLLIAGDGVSFRGAAAAEIARGNTAFLAASVDPKINRPAYQQSTGVCTSMVNRALEACLNWDRVKFGMPGDPVDLCFEPLFGISRITIGRGQLGTSDGSIGAWVAEAIARYGVIRRGVYSGTDLTRPREDLAQHWGRPGVGVPEHIMAAGRNHRFDAHRALNTETIRDANASGIFGGICRSHYASTIDRDGFAVFGNQGGHHTCLMGWYVDRDSGQRVYVEQQSHGRGRPDPNPIARTHDGDVYLGDGAYKVREADIERFIPRGEVWLFQAQLGASFRDVVGEA